MFYCIECIYTVYKKIWEVLLVYDYIITSKRLISTHKCEFFVNFCTNHRSIRDAKRLSGCEAACWAAFIVASASTTASFVYDNCGRITEGSDDFCLACLILAISMRNLSRMALFGSSAEPSLLLPISKGHIWLSHNYPRSNNQNADSTFLKKCCGMPSLSLILALIYWKIDK